MLLRHGRTADNHGGRIQGQLDTPLDEVGRRQAAATAPLLAAAAPGVLLSSDLSRARDTALVLADCTGLVPVLDPRLRELHLGTWQGLTSQEARDAHPDEHAAWRAGRDLPRGGGETYQQAGARAVACLQEQLGAVPPGGSLVAVTHGGTARAVIGLLLDLPAPSWGRLVALGNARWSVLVEGDAGWRLEQHNTGADAGAGPPNPASHGGERVVR